MGFLSYGNGKKRTLAGHGAANYLRTYKGFFGGADIMSYYAAALILIPAPSNRSSEKSGETRID